MSWRTWLGDGKREYADFNLSEFPDMEALCKKTAWQCPCKLFSPTKELADQFFQTMWRNHSMGAEEIYCRVGLIHGEMVDYEPDAVWERDET